MICRHRSVFFYPVSSHLFIYVCHVAIYITPAGKKIIQRAGDPCLAWICNVECQQVSVHVGIQCIAFDGDIKIAGNGKKSNLHRTGRVAVVDDMNAFIYFVEVNEIIFYINFSGMFN